MARFFPSYFQRNIDYKAYYNVDIWFSINWRFNKTKSNINIISVSLGVYLTCLRLPILSQYTFLFQYISSQAPLGQSGHKIQSFYSKLNELLEKYVFFLNIGQKRRVYKQIWPPISLSKFLLIFPSGAISQPTRT